MIITLITPALIRVIFFFTFFALLCLPFLFQAFRESLFQGLKEPGFYTIFLLSYLLLSLIISFILDGYTTPLIYNHITKVEPIKDPQIREVVNRLLKKSDLRLREILLVKGAKWKNANAMVSGVFPSVRFLYLTDYLMDNFSIDEIETIVAHEFGHIKYRHLEKFVLFFITVVGIMLGIWLFILYLNNSLSPSEIIVMNAIVWMAIYSLLFNFVSRKFESQADTYAVALTQKPESFISALRKLAQINEMPLTLSKGEEALQTHPSFGRRIEKINKLKDDLQNGPCEKWVKNKN